MTDIDWSNEINAMERNIADGWESHRHHLKVAEDATKRAADAKKWALEGEAKLKAIKKLRSRG